jgi:hypothetical protein
MKLLACASVTCLLGIMLIRATSPVNAQTPALSSFTGGSSFGSYNGTNMTLGWKFTVNQNIDVNDLGIWTPNAALSQSHEIGIWDNSGVLLVSATVPTSTTVSGDYAYTSVTSTLLTSGQNYFIGAEYTSPFTDVYTSGTTSVTTVSEITFDAAARTGTSAGFADPTITTSTDGRFGPNFQFTPATTVPELSSVLGFGSSAFLAGIGILRRRARRA